MPIEDIDFLGQNSELDSTLFFLDSSSRDRTAFPSPAEYVIQFSEPIKLVVGLDILDATIPATMYVIDTHSETLSVTTLCAKSDLGAGAEAQALFSAVILASNPVAIAMSLPTVTTLFCYLVSYAYSDINVTAGLGQPITTCDSSESSLFIVVVLQPGSGAYSSYSFPSVGAMDAATSSGLITQKLSMRKAIVTLQHGNYDIASLMQQVAGSIKAVDKNDSNFVSFDVVSSSSGNVSLQNRYAVINYSTPFLLDMRVSVSSAASALGFDTLPTHTASGYRDSSALPQGFGSVLSSSVPISVFSSTSFTSPVHVVVAPCVANLLGIRYITLRCPEIEQHLYSGMTYGSHSTGLGVFKLVPGLEISNLRFDFVSVVRKPFHPIGRLSRLTMRFELGDGSLYDFKGINTQLLIAVKFLSPGKRVPLTRSVLNPDYDPDFLRYTLRQTAAEMLSVPGQGQGCGLLPLEPPDDREDSEEEVNSADTVDAVDTIGRRREIAQKLLREQGKYDYPAAELDTTSWRTVV